MRRVLEEFRIKYPSTQIVVLSSLAEGADRLVAWEALDLGMLLVVPMPFEQRSYEADFASPQSVEEFRQLLSRADEAFVVPSPVASHPEPTRDLRYASCSAYIVRRCVRLVALWDGMTVPQSSTGEAVAFQLDGIPAPFVAEHRALDPTLTGPVVHIYTPRASDVQGTLHEPAVRVLYPKIQVGLGDGSGFDKLEEEIERFNRDVRAGNRDASSASNLDVQQSADALAGDFQRRVAWLLVSVFVCIFVAVLGFNVFQYQGAHPPWLLAVYLSFSIAAFAIVAVSKRADWQNRYQDYRALAEVLRVAHYWQLAGIEESAADRFARSQGAGAEWLPAAIRSVAEPFSMPPAGEMRYAHLKTVYEDWIVGQCAYFTERAGHRAHVLERASARLVTIGIAFSFAFTVLSRLLPAGQVGSQREQVMLFAAAVCGLGAGLLSD